MNDLSGANASDKPPRVSCSIDLEGKGKRHGHLTVPHSRNDSAWGSVRVPISVIANGDGPSVLLTAGNHGDEYEGQIALTKLARELEPDDINGRVIIMPALNTPAVQAGTRVSPIDGVNMNRAFPGNRDGSVTPMIAHFISSRVLPGIDAALDIHSGGKTLNFVPFAAIHRLPDPDHMERCKQAMLAFGAPVSLILLELDSEGMLDTVVEDMGKVFVSTELGGGGTSTTETIEIADTGVRNFLKHFGVLDGKPVTREERGLPPTRFMDMPDGSCYVAADEDGLFEIVADLGTMVKKGDVIARIHRVGRPDIPASVYRAPRDGMIIQRHFHGLIKVGDCLAAIGIDV